MGERIRGAWVCGFCRHSLARTPAYVAVIGLFVSGCSVIPGMEVDASGGTAGGREYEVREIDGDLVEEMAGRASRVVAAESAGDGEARYQYRVGPGDVLSVVVWNHPELTNPFGEGAAAQASGRLVHQDGTLFFPYVGPIEAEGRTVQEIQRELAEGLRPYVQEPQINVRVREFRSKRTYVTGEVRNPGALPVTDSPITILDALSKAGGFTERVPNQNPYGADARQALLTRAGRTTAIDLRALYKTGAGNRVLRDGDILHVPDDSANKVFVMGEVSRQTTVPLHNGSLTLAEAIAGAEGINLSTANTEQIYVIRGAPVAAEDGSGTRIEPHIFRLDASDATALLLADAFRMQPRDVVYVSTAQVVRWNRVMEQIAPTIRAAYQLELLDRGLSD